MRVIIVIEGGLVQSILSDSPDVQAAVIDYDTECAEEGETVEIPQSLEGHPTALAFASAFASVRTVEVNPERTTVLWGVTEGLPAEVVKARAGLIPHDPQDDEPEPDDDDESNRMDDELHEDTPSLEDSGLSLGSYAT
jgi:hypothetical protein